MADSVTKNRMRSRGRVQVPPTLTPIIGRAREIAELRDLVQAPSGRLVTITGPGGIGKTRLALEMAISLQDDPDSDVALVPLAAVQEVSRVVSAMADALDVAHDGGEIGEDDLIAAMQAWNADQPLLMVLDNLEHISGAGELIERLLDACPGLVILATSQVPLGIVRERVYPLSPLPAPALEQTNTDDIRTSDAVALFLARARERAPWFVVDHDNAATVAEICRRLDGVPLAIELAAARINVLSLPTLLARLATSLDVLGGERADRPDRLRTMRNAIDWSYDLLDAPEQLLFRRLSVFAGGFTADDAVAISSPAARGVLRILVHRSLLLRFPDPNGPARYHMLEALRAYGREQLAAHGEDSDAFLAHAMAMTALAEAAEPHLVGGEQEAWLSRLDTGVEDIRAAVAWSIANGQATLVLRIGAAVWRYFSARGYLAECRGWLERALAVRGAGEPALRAKALIALGYLSEDLRDLDAARAAFEIAQHLAAAIGDRRVEARALTGLGTVEHDRGAYDSAMALHSAAAKLSREMGDLRGVAIGTGSMAAVSYFQGRLHDAKRYWQECVRIFVQLGDTVTETQVLGNLGAVSSELEDYDAAKAYLMRAQELQRRMNLQNHLPYTLINLSEASRQTGDLALAREVLDEALTILRAAGVTLVEGHALNGLARLELAEGNIRKAARAITESTRIVAEADDRHSVIDNAEVVAMLCSTCGEHADAIELVSAAGSLRAMLSAEATPPQQRDRGAVEEAARRALAPNRLATHRQAGEAMDMATLARRVMTIGRRLSEWSERQREPEQPGGTPAVDPSAAARELGLTPRETEVLTLLAQGSSTRQVAEALYVSPRTATTHINNILGKLGVKSRTAAVAIALRAGIATDHHS